MNRTVSVSKPRHIERNYCEKDNKKSDKTVDLPRSGIYVCTTGLKAARLGACAVDGPRSQQRR
jgi:hypothetical protein